MAGKIKVPSELVPSQSNKIMIRSKYVHDDVKGHDQEYINNYLEDKIESKVIEAGGVNWDTVPTAGSNNAVKSKDIKAALEKTTGYFVLDSNVLESTVAKTVTVADFPALASGGSIKIKMLTKNTATNPTLRIGPANATAYPLYYNNERASANNTWEKNEVISVYFDGTNYQASNAQGGGGFKDIVGQVLVGSSGYITTSGTSIGEVNDGVSGWSYIKFAVNEGDIIRISGTGGGGGRLWAIAQQDGTIIRKADASEIRENYLIVMPEGAKWIVLNNNNTSYPNYAWYYAKAGSVAADAILGRNAKNIYYDNSQSGLASNNVQGALDEVAEKMFVGEPIDYVSQTTYLAYFISGAAPYKWMAASNSLPYYCRIVPISANTSYKITAADNNPTHYALLRNNTPQAGNVATDWNGGAPKTLLAGESVQINSGEYTYLYVRNNAGSATTEFKYPKEIALLKPVNATVQEMQEEIEDTLGGDYLGTDMLEPGTTDNDTGIDVASNDNVRTKYLSLGDATSVIIYNNERIDSNIYIKFSWYDANKNYKGYTGWTRVTTVQIPALALGGYVKIVFGRSPSSTTTPSDIAQFELFVNIYGQDTLVKRVEALEAKEEDDDTSMTAQLLKCVAADTIKFCTWNIGHFDLGEGTSSGITGEDYDTKLAQFRDLIYNTINPRVIVLNEYSAVFGKDANNVNHNAMDVLFNDFLIKYEGSQSNYSCNAMFASTYLVNMKMQRFDCLPHETIAGGYQDDYYYIIADLYMAGRLIKLVSSHFANTKQADQASELVSKLSSYDKVIVTGDLNTYGSSLSVFTNDGYTIGNTSINTHKVPNPTMPLDNIIYKGVNVSDIRAIDSTLSDHYPLVATITV